MGLIKNNHGVWCAQLRVHKDLQVDNNIHPTILLGGQLYNGGIDAYAFDFIDAKEVVYATFKITKKGDNLILKTIKQGVNFFPEETELFENADALKDKPLINLDLIQNALKSLKKKN